MSSRQIHVIIGLPASGKTTWMQSFAAKGNTQGNCDEEKQSIIFCDDFFDHINLNLTQIIDSPDDHNILVFADPRLTIYEQSKTFINFLLNQNNITCENIQVKLFENNPALCKENAKRRHGQNSGEHQENILRRIYSSIDSLSTTYEPGKIERYLNQRDIYCEFLPVFNCSTREAES